MLMSVFKNKQVANNPSAASLEDTFATRVKVFGMFNFWFSDKKGGNPFGYDFRVSAHRFKGGKFKRRDGSPKLSENLIF